MSANRRKMMFPLTVATALMTLAVVAYRVGYARAGGIPTPNTLTFTGSLLAFGQPDNSTHTMSLALYVSGSTTQACTTATASVTCVNGQFTIPLTPACLAIVQANPNVQAEITIDSIAMGLTSLSAVPYAVIADNATGNITPQSVGVGVAAPGVAGSIAATTATFSSGVRAGSAIEGASTGLAFQTGGGYDNLNTWQTAQNGGCNDNQVGIGRNIYQGQDGGWQSNDTCCNQQAMLITDTGFNFDSYPSTGACAGGSTTAPTNDAQIGVMGASSWVNAKGGNFGVGTASPQEPLDVSGAASFAGGQDLRDVLTWSTTATTASQVHIKTSWKTTNSAMYRFHVEGYAYGDSAAINSDCVGYLYSAGGLIDTQCNNYANGASMSEYTSSDGYLVLKLSFSSTYYIGFGMHLQQYNPTGVQRPTYTVYYQNSNL